ncbi:hypothetical protein [Aquimarina algiphila]|uniref:hypothetical protein n=1 Tax=Aquimarina algiphila TaxID=2047982 RepID=UPI00232E667A|nr:hypothetical protein [Aquimarina algiphila]
MKKLELHFEKTLQGDFKIKDLNLLLVFQVNCPGCFSYALPLFNELYHQFHKEDVSFLALSTAFEDYDKNTIAHTTHLVNDGALVGETKKMMLQQGIETLPYSLDFPIVMDKIEETLSDINVAIETICNINPSYALWPDFEKVAQQKRVAHYLRSLDKIALTFTLNQLRGTPSFVLFNNSYEIIAEWFGHITYKEIADKITSFN